ncbi:MAG: hypothetical protein DRO09_02205 [Thermoprotei archaeon]|nr:MAG: hypothetical protein DRO09_02205 [Thermoprotei archaeon]
MAEGIYKVVAVGLTRQEFYQHTHIRYINASCRVVASNIMPIVSMDVEGGFYNMSRHSVTTWEGARITFRAEVYDTPYDEEHATVIWRINGIEERGRNISIMFNKSGVYPGYVVAIDPWGAIDYEYMFIVVRNLPPQARLAVSCIGGNETYIDEDTDTIYVREDTLIIFNASQSNDTLGDLERLRYIWDMGDGTYAEGAVVNHTYTMQGTYHVVLTVLDPEGARSSIDMTVVVDNAPPSVSLSGPTVLREGETYVFVADANDTYSDLPLLEYHWLDGIGGWARTYTPLDDGVFPVGVEVFDDDGYSVYDGWNCSVINIAPDVYFTLRVWANIHFNVTGVGWERVFILMYRGGDVELNISLVHNESLGWGPHYSNITYTFLMNEDYDMYLVPVFDNETEDPWVNIKTWFSFDNTTSPTIEAQIYYIDGTPYCVASEKQGVYGAVYENGAWKIWINPEEVCDIAPLSIHTYVWDPGADDIYLRIRYYENGSLIEEVWFNSTYNGTWPTRRYYVWRTIVSENATITFEAWDEDGGYTCRTLEVYRVHKEGWDMIPEYIPPRMILEVQNQTLEDTPTTFTLHMLGGDKANYTIIVDYGDGEREILHTNKTSINVTHTYIHSGTYLVRFRIIHGKINASWAAAIRVENYIPTLGAPDIIEGMEGIPITITVEPQDTWQDMQNITTVFIIENTIIPGENATYTWPDSGTYTVKAITIDDDGDKEVKNITIVVKERKPRFASPEKFYAEEADPITLYIWIEDSPQDILQSTIKITMQDNLQWINDTWIIFDDLPHITQDTNKIEIYNTTQITFWLDDGEYTMHVEIQNGEETYTKTIQITVTDRKPVILTPPQSYVIKNTTQQDQIQIHIYGYDIYTDIHQLQYTIEIPDLQINMTQDPKTSATFTIDPTQIPGSKDYTTKITLKDDTTRDEKTTRIRIYIDNDQDGIPDDLGLLHILPDDDHDQIPSAFEPILGIDPEDPDTDHDGLIDGEEYFGWETEITTNAGREKIWVYSNPNNTDTDGDGLDDLTEKQLGTNPTSKDTDMDGLQDQMEIALNTTPTDWDTDNDGLPDGNETTLGTDPLSTDTDADGIPDYEEIYKHGTDPTCNDTDGDGLGDGEETFTVTYSLDEKCNFSWPKTFSIYVPVEYSQSTTITIGLGDVEKGTTIRAEIRHNGEKIWSTEEEAERPYTWTKTINITGGYVKGTWTLAIAPWPPERILLDKYTIEITARADPLKNDTDGDGIPDGEEVGGMDRANKNMDKPNTGGHRHGRTHRLQGDIRARDKPTKPRHRRRRSEGRTGQSAEGKPNARSTDREGGAGAIQEVRVEIPEGDLGGAEDRGVMGKRQMARMDDVLHAHRHKTERIHTPIQVREWKDRLPGQRRDKGILRGHTGQRGGRGDKARTIHKEQLHHILA